MTEEKAKRAVIQIGPHQVDGFQMPDGSYRMSQASAAEAISESPVYALRFLQSKAVKPLLDNAFTDYTFQVERVEVEPEDQILGQTRINALPIEIVSAYWLYRSHKGNKQALALCLALTLESLERRFDAAFLLFACTESERNAWLFERLMQEERANKLTLAALAQAIAEPTLLRQENARLQQQIREMGAEPWEFTGGVADATDKP